MAPDGKLTKGFSEKKKKNIKQSAVGRHVFYFCKYMPAVSLLFITETLSCAGTLVDITNHCKRETLLFFWGARIRNVLHSWPI